MKSIGILFLALIGVVAIGGLAYRATYNNLITLREEAVSASHEVQVACQRQADLVPNLVKAVKSCAAHESATLIGVAEAHASAVKALASKPAESFAADPQAQKELAAAQQALRASMINVMAVAESNPQLRAVELYRDFTAQLEGSQNRISTARVTQTRKAKGYNAARQGFLTAMFLGDRFGPIEYFEGAVGEKSSVEVNL